MVLTLTVYDSDDPIVHQEMIVGARYRRRKVVKSPDCVNHVGFDAHVPLASAAMLL